MTLLDRKVAALVFVVCLVVWTSACGSRTTPATKPSPPDATKPVAPSTAEPRPSPPGTTAPREADPLECALITEPGDAIATVGLAERINPSNAPYPSNESERLIFRQLYETLVRVDCDGDVRPGLAASLRRDADGRPWIVTLRENAQFSDGTPVTANDVRAAWTVGGVGDVLRPQVSRLVQSIVAIDDRSLAITLRRPRDLPLALAHTDLTIAKRAGDARWPLGTRSARPAPVDDVPITSAHASITLERDGLPSIRFLIASGDPRDLLDEGVDLLLTRDPATLRYAATLTQFQSVPLAWQRTRVLLTPGRLRTSPSLPEDARRTLAADAVRGEARGAVGPFWWQALQDCELAGAPSRDQAPTPRIVYDASDDAARDLAERLVGLVRASGASAAAILDAVLPDRPRRTYQRATGLTGDPLARALRLGADAGYIMSLDSRPLDSCHEMAVVMDRTPWVEPETIVPLIETRQQAIVRRGRSGITADWDGGLLIAGVSSAK